MGENYLDSLLVALIGLSQQVIPILVALVLIFLSIFLKKLINLVISLDKTIKNLSTTVSLVDTSLTKIQEPLDTVVKLSHTVDDVHENSKEVVRKANEYVNENIGEIKSCVNTGLEKVKEHFVEKEKTYVRK